eukprot:COSAG02_NODE_1386_length_12941_cov_32.080128_4_plen_103_part_00
MLVGAGSNSSVWSQILADVLNVSIEVRGDVGSLDVSARGNAMIGEVALDSTASLELPSNVRHLSIYTIHCLIICEVLTWRVRACVCVCVCVCVRVCVFSPSM